MLADFLPDNYCASVYFSAHHSRPLLWEVAMPVRNFVRSAAKQLFALTLAGLLPVFSIALADEPISGLGPTGPVKKLQEKLQFTEGPAYDGKGHLYFSDIPANRIYRVDGENKMEVFLEPSGHTNGLFFDGKGRLHACAMDGQIIRIDTAKKDVTVLAKEFEGKRFNAPNDLVIDAAGGIYFTDPRFRAPEPLPQPEAVYYLSPEGKVTRLDEYKTACNGVILSPDEKTLYVIPSMQSEMVAYDVTAPGKVGNKRTFCTLKQAEGKSGGGGDGLTVDVHGNLYITSGLGLQVFSPAGKLLGVIACPEQPANVAFGGPENKTLMVTARTGLYAIPMEVAGHVFPAGKAK